jgi:3-methyladenine DNA glycosylase AlkD
MLSSYSQEVIHVFKQHEDKNRAVSMAKYMKNKFEYFGIPSPLRKEISNPLQVKTNQPNIDHIPKIIRELWGQPQRELQYFALELLDKYDKRAPSNWIDLYAELIASKSWWDTVDGLAAWQVGDHFNRFPSQIIPYTMQWMDSQNVWLQRTCLIFQLRYKKNTDFELMKSFIVPLSGHKDFFIRKAIGWALRQYAKVNPEDVKEFVSRQVLSNLSKREALKHF